MHRLLATRHPTTWARAGAVRSHKTQDMAPLPRPTKLMTTKTPNHPDEQFPTRTTGTGASGAGSDTSVAARAAACPQRWRRPRAPAVASWLEATLHAEWRQLYRSRRWGSTVHHISNTIRLLQPPGSSPAPGRKNPPPLQLLRAQFLVCGGAAPAKEGKVSAQKQASTGAAAAGGGAGSTAHSKPVQAGPYEFAAGITGGSSRPLKVRPVISRGIHVDGFAKPSAAQQQAIEPILTRSDTIVTASGLRHR